MIERNYRCNRIKVMNRIVEVREMSLTPRFCRKELQFSTAETELI